MKLKVILILFLSSCATPTQLINRALKKDPEILRSRTSAEVTYVPMEGENHFTGSVEYFKRVRIKINVILSGN